MSSQNLSIKHLSLATLISLSSYAAQSNAIEIYADDFDRANNTEVANGWIELERDANDVAIYNNELRLRDQQTGIDAAIWQNLSTQGYHSLSLTFDWRASSSTETSDTLHVGWSDNSVDWIEIWQTALGGSDFETMLIDFSAEPDDLSAFSLAFWIDVSASTETVYLDNISLTGERIQTPQSPSDFVSVPEPSSFVLLGLGLFGLGLRRNLTA